MNGLLGIFRRGRLRAAIDRLFGYDVFISYRRRDASGYAEALAQALRERGLSVFIDQKEYGPGDRIDASTIRHVSMSTVLVLLGSPAVLERRDPDWIVEEIKVFRGFSPGTSRTILPVDFGCTLASLPKASGLAAEIGSYLRLDQSPDALNQAPQPAVLDAIRRQFNRRTRERSRLLTFQGIAVVVALLAVAVIIFGLLRAQAVAEAHHRTALSYLVAASERLAVRRTNEAVALATESLSHIDSPDARRLIVQTPILDQVLRLEVDTEVRELVASQRGSRIAAITGKAKLLVWTEGSSDKSPRTEDRGVEINALAISEDGATIVTVNVEGRVDMLDTHLWKWRSCDITGFLDGGSLPKIAIDARRQKLFVAARGRILMFELSANCRQRGEIALDEDDTSGVVTIAVAEDKTRLVIVQAMSITIIDLESLRHTARWKPPPPPGGVERLAGEVIPHSYSISAAASDPVADQLAIGLDDGRLYVLQVPNLVDALIDSERRIPTSMYKRYSGIAFSNDGRWLFALQARGDIKVVRTYDLQIEHVVTAYAHSATHLAVRGEVVVTAGLGPSGAADAIKVWRAGDSSRRRRHELYAGGSQAVEQIVSVSAAPRGTDLALSTDLGTVLVYDASTGANRRRIHKHSDNAPWVAFDPLGRFVASVSYDRDLHVADRDGREVFSGRPVSPTDENEPEALYAGLWSPNGDFVIVADGMGSLRAQGVVAGSQPGSWGKVSGGVDALSWWPAPDRLLGILLSQSRLISITRQNESSAGSQFDDRISHLASTADGRLLAIYGQRIEVWRLANDKSSKRIAHASAGDIAALSLDRDGRWLAVARDTRRILLYDITNVPDSTELPLAAEFMVEDARIKSITITSDGWIAVGCDDGTVRMFLFAELSSPKQSLVDAMRLRVGIVTPDLKMGSSGSPPSARSRSASAGR